MARECSPISHFQFRNTPHRLKLSMLLMQAEVKYLGQLYHPNLVKLVGYCFEEEQRLLVYEFMSKGSLENHLFRSMFVKFIIIKTIVVG